jgi:hypothetical protein
MGFRKHMAGHAREAAYYNKDSRQYKSVMLPASFGSTPFLQRPSRLRHHKNRVFLAAPQ